MANRRAHDPRRDAMREALASVWTRGRHSVADTRTALVAELARRGIADPTADELDYLDGMLTAPRRTAFKIIRRQVAALRSPLAELRRELRVGSIPRWARTPRDVPNPRDQPYQPYIGEPAAFDLSPDQLVRGRSTVARLLSEVQDQSFDDEEQIRPIEAWVSLDDDGSIGVHVGQSRLSTISGEPSQTFQAAIRRWGRRRGALSAGADLLGAHPDTAHLQIWIDTPSTPQA